MKKNKIVNIILIVVILFGIQLPVVANTTGTVNVDTARVREEATTDSDILKLVSIGDKITITGEEGDWYKVKVGKTTGYIKKDLLTVKGNTGSSNNQGTNEKPTEVKPQEEIPAVEVPSEENPSKETPSEEIPAEDTPAENIQNEDTISISEIKGKKISVLKLAKGVSVGEIIQLTEEIQIKILPSANSTNIEKLTANTQVTVLEVLNSWCRVETQGACGWVRIDQ